MDEGSSNTCRRIINAEHCIKCQDPCLNNELQTLTPQGLRTIMAYSEAVGDSFLKDYLMEHMDPNVPVKINRQCQKDAYNKLKRKGAQSDAIRKKVQRVETRKSVVQFAWKRDCLYCGLKCFKDVKHQTRDDFMQVRTIPFRTNVLKCCEERGDDELSVQVKRRVLDCHDLVAAEARYHVSCYRKFTKQRQEKDPNFASPGRPVHSTRITALNEVCEWMESEAELYTLQEVHDKMAERAGTEDLYSKKWLKTKIQERYGNHVIFYRDSREVERSLLEGHCSLLNQ